MKHHPQRARAGTLRPGGAKARRFPAHQDTLTGQAWAALARWARSDSAAIRASALAEAGSCFEYQARIRRYAGPATGRYADDATELAATGVLLRMLADAEGEQAPGGTDTVSTLVARYAAAPDPAERGQLLGELAQQLPSGPDSHPAQTVGLMAGALRPFPKPQPAETASPLPEMEPTMAPHIAPRRGAQ